MIKCSTLQRNWGLILLEKTFVLSGGLDLKSRRGIVLYPHFINRHWKREIVFCGRTSRGISVEIFQGLLVHLKLT